MVARLLGQLVGGWASSRGFLSKREFRLFASRHGAIAQVTLGELPHYDRRIVGLERGDGPRWRDRSTPPIRGW